PARPAGPPAKSAKRTKKKRAAPKKAAKKSTRKKSAKKKRSSGRRSSRKHSPFQHPHPPGPQPGRPPPRNLALFLGAVASPHGCAAICCAPANGAADGAYRASPRALACCAGHGGPARMALARYRQGFAHHCGSDCYAADAANEGCCVMNLGIPIYQGVNL